MAKKKTKRARWTRAIFLEACDKLKPFADHWHSVDDMEIDGIELVNAMQGILNRHGEHGLYAATAIASAWNWLLQDPYLRCSISECSEHSVASDYYMAFWWLGMEHADMKPNPLSPAQKKPSKKRR